MLPIVVTDGRFRAQYNVFFRGADPALVDVIQSHPALQGLAAEMGLAFVEVVQILDKPFDMAAGVFTRLARRATPQAQARTITSSIARLPADGIVHDLVI